MVEKTLHQSVAFLKQNLEDVEVESFAIDRRKRHNSRCFEKARIKKGDFGRSNKKVLWG